MGKKLGLGLGILLGILSIPLALFYRAEIPLEELLPRYADDASQFPELAGQNLHVKDEGDGPCLLLIHGTAASLHTWDGWVEELRSEFRLLRLDLPGFGLSGPHPSGDHGADTRLAAIEAVLDHAGVDSCSLAGNSLGGFLAWRFVLRWPERVERLVLIDAAGYPRQGDGGGNVLSLARIPVLNTLLTRITPRHLVEKGLRQVYGDPSKFTPELADRYYDLLLREGNRQALVGGGSRGESQIHRLGEIHHPTLILWGALDSWIPVEDAHRFHDDLPNAQLRVYEGVGHVPMEEIPIQTARDAREFLLAP